MAMSFGVDKDYYERVSEEGKPRPFCKSHPNDILDPCQVQYQLQLHTFGNKKYPLPFYHERSEEFDSRNEEPWGDVPRTIVELRMCALSSSIRDKPHWHTKFRDPEIRAKWTEEALEQTASRPEWNLTPKMVRHLLPFLVVVEFRIIFSRSTTYSMNSKGTRSFWKKTLEFKSDAMNVSGNPTFLCLQLSATIFSKA